ncbi:hypothetical protein F4859DRAFT_498655 [Xylaria cf. heliscus]|nr:hypothetical protein F4859DRAFT_498655 [Xylaria cf. heliscus]
MSWRDNPTPEDHRRLHVPFINWEYDDSKWKWPHFKFGYKRDVLFQSLHAEFNCMAFAIQDPFSWYCDVHELSTASESREEFETALRKRRDERFKEIDAAWRTTVTELILNTRLWEDPKMDRLIRWDTFIDMSRHFSFDSILTHFGNYLPESRSSAPDERSAAAPRELEQPEQPRQPNQPSIRKQSGLDDEAETQLRSHIQGLINRLTNDNITGIIEDVTYLYQTKGRQLVDSALIDLIIMSLGSSEKRTEWFFIMIAGFIVEMGKTMGVPVSALFIRQLIETMEQRSTAASGGKSDTGSQHPDVSPPSPPPPPPKKTGRKTRGTREKAGKGPGRASRVEKPSLKQHTTRKNALNSSEGPRRSARLQQRAERGGSG